MNPHAQFERDLEQWLHTEAPTSAPAGFHASVMNRAGTLSQRPGWTLPERWIPMQLAVTRTRSFLPGVALSILALLVVALVATALVIGSLRHRTPSLYRNGAVVYEQDGDLFIADQLGGTPRPLVMGRDDDLDPVFSPQGDRIAFVRGGTTIMSIAPDGADLTELATVDGIMKRLGLGWSPDGSSLLASFFGTGEQWYQTDVIASDGSGSRRLGVANHVVSASWRPDGRQILFCGLLDGDDATRGVYIADADGSDVRPLPGSRFSLGCRVVWSPDGNRLAFASEGVGGAGIGVVAIDAAGALSDMRRVELDATGTLEGGPEWSPDGGRLAFVMSKGDDEVVGVVDPDGSGYRIVVPAGPMLWDPRVTWSPDGRLLVIVEQSHAAKVWSVDVADGERTEVQTPVETWQRLAP